MMRLMGYLLVLAGLPLLIFCWPGILCIGVGALLLIATRPQTEVEISGRPTRSRLGGPLLLLAILLAGVYVVARLNGVADPVAHFRDMIRDLGH